MSTLQPSSPTPLKLNLNPPRPIHSPLSSTQIPTLTSNHTHPHPHLHPPSHLLPSHQIDTPKRSISYSTTPTTHPATPVASTFSPSSISAANTTSVTTTNTTTPAPSIASEIPPKKTREKEKHDDRTCDQKVKGALTELLNDGSVKADDRGRRSVQRLLMETERELRTQRRESLSLSLGDRGRRKGKGKGIGMGRELGMDLEGEGSGSCSGSGSGSRESVVLKGDDRQEDDGEEG